MQITDRQRLKIVRKALKLNQKEFGESVGLSQGGYSDIERGKNGISPRIKIFLNQVHNINIHWLETGEGEMFSLTEEDMEKHLIGFPHPSDINLSKEYENLKQDNDQQKKEILALQAEINLYKNLCITKDKVIKGLEEQVQLMKEILKKEK
jgi:transcriptional regulator with XRE-family HTH domain